MKTIKVFYNGEPLRNIYPHATKWQVIKYRIAQFFRKLIIGLSSIAILYSLIYGAYTAGRSFNPVTVYAEKIVEVVTDKPTPVLERIAKCESGNMHYKNGQVIIKANTNGSTDIGRYQINSLWNKKATSLDLDLTKEKDNEAMAIWLYKNYGTEPWVWSKNCWNK